MLFYQCSNIANSRYLPILKPLCLIFNTWLLPWTTSKIRLIRQPSHISIIHITKERKTGQVTDSWLLCVHLQRQDSHYELSQWTTALEF